MIGDEHGHEQQHGDHVAQNALGGIVVSLAQLKGYERVTAAAHQHAERHHDDHGGERRGGTREAELTDAVPDEDRVDQVVDGIDEDADDGGNPELEEELRDRPLAHPLRAVSLSGCCRRHGRHLPSLAPHSWVRAEYALCPALRPALWAEKAPGCGLKKPPDSKWSPGAS